MSIKANVKGKLGHACGTNSKFKIRNLSHYYLASING